MDWTALVIGLLGGLAGSLVGAAAGVIAVLVQSDAEVDREERAAARAYRSRSVEKLRQLLEVSEGFLSSSFQRTLWDQSEAQRRDFLTGLGLTDEQLGAARELADQLYAPFPVPTDVIRDFTGVVMALEDEELANHFFLLQMELGASHPPGFLEPQQIRFLVVRTNQLLEQFAAKIPLQRRTFLQRIARSVGIGHRIENAPRAWDVESLERLLAEVRSVKPSESQRS